MISKIKQRRIDVKKVAWLSVVMNGLQIAAVTALVVMVFLSQKRDISPDAEQWIVLAGALLVLCTAGRKKKGIGKLVGGLGGLYNITGYVSDILSYTRIFALSLATGVVGMVMNILAGMVQGSVIGFVFSLAIYLVGHVFNIAMNVLGSYVHTSRLQYIEFFGKFYEGGGYAFTPMQPQLNYVELKQSEQ